MKSQQRHLCSEQPRQHRRELSDARRKRGSTAVGIGGGAAEERDERRKKGSSLQGTYIPVNCEAGHNCAIMGVWQ